ncbi:CIC11C00000005746 [Sungouiella intermedia]|uniref:CIC11C00000005746 n=1 Tax=Sungouiella intermedia TaxID=45354 RepID=A0A1L0BKD4_9ASCO|nr:CIC11C00000005746 [[Candida] intermedia]
MNTLSTLFELIPLGSILLLLCAWSYRFFFNHEIIRNYTNRRHVPKSQINDLIGKEANEKYGCTLLHLNVEDELEEEKLPVLLRKPYAELHQKHVHRVVGLIFSLVTALSIELVGVFMAQLVGIFEADTLFLRVGIRTLVILVTMVQPLLVVSLYMNQDLLPSFSGNSPGSFLRIAATFALCGAWFYFLHRIGELANALGAISDKSFLERKTNEVVLTGITITAILSGVGCALTPVRRFWLERESQMKKARTNGKAKETQLNDLIQSYNTTKMLISKRQHELNDYLVTSGGTVYNQTGPDQVRLLKGSGKQLLHKVQSFASISSFGGNREEEELKREIESLKQLKALIYSDVTRELHKFLLSKRSTPISNKTFEQLVKAFDLAFALYCIYRIFNVLLLRLPYQYFWSSEDLHTSNNIIDDKEVSGEALNKNTKDALAITIAKIIQSVFGYLPMSEVQLINQVSFILSGSLFVCSFQNVLVTFKSLGRFLPTTTTTVSSSVKSWLKNLVVSEFLAIYVIATALLIRTNLPEETAKLMLRILSLSTSLSSSVNGMQIEVEFIDNWFDKVFGLTCVITIIVILLKYFIESDNVYDDGYDEEMFIEDPARFKML